jgi:hypothetical protein
VRTSSPASSASRHDDEPSRRPTTTLTPGVVEVERVGVTLAPVADDGHVPSRRERSPSRRIVAMRSSFRWMESEYSSREIS